VKVWPGGMPETFCADHWRARFHRDDMAPITHRDVLSLLDQVLGLGLDFIKTEHLCTFDGEPGFSLGQGQ
jgi:isocitrate dehydrogenase